MKTTNQHRKYWAERKIDWKTQYFDTHGHPHRELILQTMAKFRFGSVLEIGCGAGANLLRVNYAFPGVPLGGVDINPDAIAEAKKQMPGMHWDVGPADDLFFSDKSTDLILTDACLIYIGPTKIGKTLDEIKRVARKNVVFCEFHSSNPFSRFNLWRKTGYYAYNYKALLERHGFYEVELRKIPAKKWPGTPWEEWGFIINATL